MFGMVTSEHQKGLEDSIRDKFKEVYLEVTGREYEKIAETVYSEVAETGSSALDEYIQKQENINLHQERAGR